MRAAAEIGPWIVTAEAEGADVAVYDLARWSERWTPRRLPAAQREVRPGPRLAIADLLPGAQGPIEWLTTIRGGESGIVAFAWAGGHTAAYLLTVGPESDPRTWRARRITGVNDWLAGGVTVCAGGDGAVYVALKNQGIAKVIIERDDGARAGELTLTAKMMARAGIHGPSGWVNVSGLAVWNVSFMREVVYAVAGDDAVYGFRRVVGRDHDEGARRGG